MAGKPGTYYLFIMLSMQVILQGAIVIGGFENGCVIQPRLVLVRPQGGYLISTILGRPDVIAPSDEDIKAMWVVTDQSLIDAYREQVTGLKLAS